MSDSKSPSASNGDFQFSSDEEYRRPRRAAVNRNAFVESGSESDEPSKKRKQPKKKVSKKQPPAKKAKIGSSSDSDSDGELGDKDSKMQHLTEKERELEIFRHIEQQELLKTRKQIQEKLLGGDEDKSQKGKKKGARSDKESGEESSSSSDGEVKTTQKRGGSSDESEIEMDPSYHKPSDVAEKLEKRKAIADLVKSRKEKKLQEQKKKETLDVDKVFGASSDSEESSSSDSSESDSEDSDEERDQGVPDSLKEPISEISHLNMMRISRFRLSKICHAPFFEKTVTGCFVRVGVGVNNGQQVYRAAQVIGVCETAKQYMVEKVKTNKGLRLKHGPDERVYRLEFISNQAITEREFYKWKDAMMRAELPLPSIELAERKKKDIDDASNYTFTDDDIKAVYG
ncbi:hypothetical protein FO519_007708 [Halicephalobus sp. NKZ332]|nr:hypothetical protein FO519_007708 [Halicephalobus sp. NKZ332]